MHEFNPSACQADFRCTITPKTIEIHDTGKGKKSVADDLEAVLRKIEYWHQGSIPRCRITYQSTQGTEHLVEWDGERAREQHQLEIKQGEAANFTFIEPMKALRLEELPVGDWIYELKFDGSDLEVQSCPS